MKITPVIKKTRITKEKYEICPHCNEEIREKSIYVDPENYVYHRSCRDKGPIDKIKPVKIENIFNFKNPFEIPIEFNKVAENKKYDPKEIQMGVEAEKEHKNVYDLFESFCKKNNLKMPISEKELYEMITKVHLGELENYYTRLKKMEKEGKKEIKDDIRLTEIVLEKKLEASLKKLNLKNGNK